MNIKSLLGGTYEALEPSEEETDTTRTRANSGDAEAQFELGLMYREGKGVPKDDVEAFKWLNLAATYAPASEQKQYAEARDAVSKRLTPQQRAEGQRRSREWFAAHPRE